MANRDLWTVTAIDDDGGLRVRGRPGDRTLLRATSGSTSSSLTPPPSYGTQGETADHALLVVGETTGAAAAYVGMTRGRERNTAHLLTESTDAACASDIDRYGRRGDRPQTGDARQ